MGAFDFFGRDAKVKRDDRQREVVKPVINEGGFNSPVSVFSPTSYDDVSVIIDSLKTGKTAVVHLTELKTETAIRVLDMLSGAIYALGGGVYEMQKNIFMFSPAGVEMNG